jgi:hypothetical protein
MGARQAFIASLVVAGMALVVTGAVHAQGRGAGPGKGGGPAPAATRLNPDTGPNVGFRQFGSWLDDASILQPRTVWTALWFGHFRWPGGRETDFPSVDAAFGLTPRMQFGISVPYYRRTFADGSHASGMGDSYLVGKVGLIDPATASNGFGLAVSPLFEILGSPDPVKGGRAYWGVPVSVEWRQPKYRVYGSSGWFSRGAFFAGGALELPLTGRTMATGALIHTRALNDDANADANGLSKTRTDLTGGAAYFVTPSIALFGNLGRTISGQDAAAASLMLSAGASMTFAGTPPRGPQKRRKR